MYKIQRHPFDFVTGKAEKDLQVLMGLLYPFLAAVFFDYRGRLLEVQLKPLPFKAKAMGKDGPYLVEDPEFQRKVDDELASWQTAIGFTPSPICVGPFFVPGFTIGIEDLPRHLQEFVENTDCFSEGERLDYSEILERWKNRGSFVLWWGKDYHMTGEGEGI